MFSANIDWNLVITGVFALTGVLAALLTALLKFKPELSKADAQNVLAHAEAFARRVNAQGAIIDDLKEQVQFLKTEVAELREQNNQLHEIVTDMRTERQKYHQEIERQEQIMDGQRNLVYELTKRNQELERHLAMNNIKFPEQTSEKMKELMRDFRAKEGSDKEERA